MNRGMTTVFYVDDNARCSRLLGSVLAEYGFDSVVCLNVLEHVSDDRKALEHMYALLRPGGSVILIIPAFESLYGPIDSIPDSFDCQWGMRTFP